MSSYRIIKDKIAQNFMLVLTIFSGLLVFLITCGLFVKAKSILTKKSIIDLILSSSWHPFKGEFGFFPFIMGTIWVTGVAIIIAIPLCLLTSIYLSEYAPAKIREFTSPLIDLLAGIPSVIYGIWGILIIVPIIKNNLTY